MIMFLHAKDELNVFKSKVKYDKSNSNKFYDVLYMQKTILMNILNAHFIKISKIIIFLF